MPGKRSGYQHRLVNISFLIAIGHAYNVQQLYQCCGSDIDSPIEIISLNDLKVTYPNGANATGTRISWREPAPEIVCHPTDDILTSNFSFYPNDTSVEVYSTGYLRKDDSLFLPHEYCFLRADDVFTVKTLDPKYCSDHQCIRKCCDPLEVYDFSTYGYSKIKCVRSQSQPWRPHTYPKVSNSMPTLHFQSEKDRTGWCKSGNKIVWSLRNIRTDPKSLFRILRDGSVVMRTRMEWKSMNTSNICIDGAINIPGYFDPSSKQSLFSDDELNTIIVECDPTEADPGFHPTLLYAIGLVIATVFQLGTLVVYGLLWDKQNVHGWTLFGYISNMLVFYVATLASIAYVHIHDYEGYVTEYEIISSPCGIIGIIIHFFNISTICWLTVISTDIFLTFRILKLTRGKSKNKLKIFIYLIFTLLVPTVIVGVGISLDLAYGDELEVNVILPKYGRRKCFLDLTDAAFPYLYGPIGVLLSFNLIMYLATIFHLYRIQESTKMANANNNHVHKQRAKIKLFSKLFLLMGISWLWEVISFLVFGAATTNYIEIIGDFINILKPIAIFVVFVCKKDIIKSLGEKYSCVTRVFSTVEQEDSMASSSSERGTNKLTRLLNPGVTAKWFRARTNSTLTESSNLSNQSIKSACINPILEESPEATYDMELTESKNSSV